MNDKKDKIDYLTDELMNNLSVDDREHLESWMEESAFHKKFHDLVMRMNFSSQVSAMAEEMRESILLQIHHRIDQAERRSLWLKISAVAASVLILLGATNYFSYYQGYKQLNSQIVEMYNPLGMQSSIVLPDGTKVTLNAGTTLKYPTAFVSKFRKVEVEGEAYFEVAHNEKHPFIVKADNINVRVLGTKFDVKAYRGEDRVGVTLEDGEVMVGLENQQNPIRMLPGQQVFYDKTLRKMIRQQVNTGHLLSWKEGKFYFDSATLEMIARQLERRFDVEILIASEELKKTVYTGDFVRQESLVQILKVITADKRMRYRMDGDKVYIFNKESSTNN